MMPSPLPALSIRQILALWELGLLSSDAVVAWGDTTILLSEFLPDDLMELSLYGPEACLRRPTDDFASQPLLLTFPEEFSAKAVMLELTSDVAVHGFAAWVSGRVYMPNGDFNDPCCQFGVDIERKFDDLHFPNEAVALVRKELPALMPHCEGLVTRLLDATLEPPLSLPATITALIAGTNNVGRGHPPDPA